MSPHPLSNYRPGATVDFSPGAIAKNTELAALAMQIVGEWSFVDFKLVEIATGLMGSDFAITAVMLTALRSSDAVRAVVSSGVAYSTTDDDLDLFQRAMKAIGKVRECRNRYAHGVWGYSPDCPDALLLVDWRDLARHHGETEEARRKFVRWMSSAVGGAYGDDTYGGGTYGGGGGRSGPPPAKPAEIDHSRISVYRRPDMESDLERVRHAVKIMDRLSHAFARVSGSGLSRRWLRTELPNLGSAGSPSP